MSRNFELLRQANRDQEVFGLQDPNPESALSSPRLFAAELEKDLGELLQRIVQSPEGQKRGSVLFSAVEPGAGTTWICAALGRLLSTSTFGTVCLVDANFRAPALHGYFGLDLHPGLWDALVELERPISDFIRSIGGASVSLLPAGTRQPRSSLVAPASFASRLRQLRDRFDLVLIDAPAASAGPEAFLYSEHVDGVALVLAANSSRREAARKVREGFENGRKAPVIGAVLNKRTHPIPEVIYRVL